MNRLIFSILLKYSFGALLDEEYPEWILPNIHVSLQSQAILSLRVKATERSNAKAVTLTENFIEV